MPIIDGGLLFARVIVGGIILIAGLAKLKAGHKHFVQVILKYDLLPKPIVIAIAYCLPWLEIVAGAGLIIGVWTSLMAVFSSLLLMLFSSVVGINLWRRRQHECGCFHTVAPIQWQLVYRNIGLMTLLMPVYALQGGGLTFERWVGLPGINENQFWAGLAVIISTWLLVLSATLLLQQLSKLKRVADLRPARGVKHETKQNITS